MAFKLIDLDEMMSSLNTFVLHPCVINLIVCDFLLLYCRRFFLEVSTVEEPEGHFNIDEYTDVVMVTKPVIYISVQEICDTHTLLLDHRDEIAPDTNDPLHELLDDLGDAPCVEALLGNTIVASHDQSARPTTS